jgi:transposase
MDTTNAPLASIGIDIGKKVFHIVGFGTNGKTAFRRKITRLAWGDTFRGLPSCVVGMEACRSGLVRTVIRGIFGSFRKD